MTRDRAVLFDMDDTLYDEATFVRSGFAHVAGEIARLAGVSADDVEAHMHRVLGTEGRGRIFDSALAFVGIRPEPALVARLVTAYREHRPAIALDPKLADMLTRLRSCWRLGIVTDGLATVQRRKVAALGLDSLVDTIVYCWEEEAPKPHTSGFLKALQNLLVAPERAVVVGDRPDHDMAAARAIGARCIRVLTGRFRDERDSPGTMPDAIVSDLASVEPILTAWAAE